jgi:hypothetical protein
MEFILVWGAASILTGAVASSRHRNPVGWFIIAMVASPLLALLALIAMPPRETVPIREDTTYRDTPWWQRMP